MSPHTPGGCRLEWLRLPSAKPFLDHIKTTYNGSGGTVKTKKGKGGSTWAPTSSPISLRG
jgi:hypothetical protein